jgi:SAM-dependent methyltransferase
VATSNGTWPKVRNALSADQAAALEDWYGEFLSNVLPDRFGWIDRFNHQYPLRSAGNADRTLEIGPGNGSHIEFEDMSTQQEYVALELRPALSDQITTRYPNLKIVIGDCQTRLDFEEDTFDRVLAIHVLEHLDNLPAALREIARVLKPSGLLSVVIPAEGGLAYEVGRRLTVQRRFQKRYKMPYTWVIRHEHINTAREVIGELNKIFRVQHRSFYPLHIPLVDLNVVLGLTLSLD